MDNLKNIRTGFILNRLERRGAQHQLFNFLNLLSNHLDVCIFCFSDTIDDFPEMAKIDGTRMVLNTHHGKFNLMKFKSLKDFLKKERLDVMVTMGLGSALFAGRLNALVSVNVKIVYSILNTLDSFHKLFVWPGDYFDVFNKLLNFFIPRLKSENVFRFLPNSNQLASKLSLGLENYKISPLLNAIPHNGLEKILLETPGDKIRVLKEKIIGRPTIVQVGALDENKNQLFSLNCLKAIKEKVPDVLLLIIGDGCKKSDLMRHAQEQNINGHVFFSGELERKDCLHLMRASDLLILTSKSESFPNVYLEAQLLELPVVSFDVGAASDIIGHGETGYLIQNNQMNRFVESIVRLLLDKKMANQFGSAGKQRIIQHFSMQRKVENFLQLLSADLKAVHWH